MKRRPGVGIVEISFVVLVAALMIGIAAKSILHRGGQDGLADARNVRALIAEARAAAGKTGNGATIAFSVPVATAGHRGGGYRAVIYSGRPTGAGVGLPGAPQIGLSTLTDGVGSTFSVFFSSSGSAALADGWIPGSAYPASTEPACAGNFSIQIHAPGERAGAVPPSDRNLTIDCETGDVSAPRRY